MIGTNPVVAMINDPNIAKNSYRHDPSPNTQGPDQSFPYVVPGGQNNNAPANTTNNQSTITDPYSTGQHSYLNSFGSLLSNIGTGASDAFKTGTSGYQSNANDLLSGYRPAQQNLDTSRQNNELGRMNATQDLLGYIRSGLKQGTSQISNMNAMDSSAVDALSRAYNMEGAQKQRGINNQAADVGHNLDIQQGQLTQGLQDNLTRLHSTRDGLVNQISSNVRDKLTLLNQQAVGLSLPDQINVEQQKQAIIDAGMGQLQDVDSWLQSQIATIQPMSSEEVMKGARTLQQAGTGMPNTFDIGQTQQTQVQGPQVSQLPLYSNRRYN